MIASLAALALLAAPVQEEYFPLAEGTVWTYRTIAYTFANAGEEEVEVPAGKFRAWKVKVLIVEGQHRFEGFEWFAKDVGLVKSEITISSRTDSYTTYADLKEFRKGE
jgi:hypothetical protein